MDRHTNIIYSNAQLTRWRKKTLKTSKGNAVRYHVAVFCYVTLQQIFRIRIFLGSAFNSFSRYGSVRGKRNRIHKPVQNVISLIFKLQKSNGQRMEDRLMHNKKTIERSKVPVLLLPNDVAVVKTQEQAEKKAWIRNTIRIKISGWIRARSQWIGRYYGSEHCLHH